MAMIEQKVQGEEITIAPADEPGDKIIDLMDALKASLTAGVAGEPTIGFANQA